MAFNIQSWTSILLISLVLALHSHRVVSFTAGPWKEAHATFYGGPDGSGTMGGACGYKDLKEEGYGLRTAAVSSALFNDGKDCGACYEIKCMDDKFCKPGVHPINITATNLCPPNSEGGWCDPPKEHFDLSEPAFIEIAEGQAGHVPIHYRRVPCKKGEGIKFTISGDPNAHMVLITNVPGAGEIESVEVQGHDKTKWSPLKRNWGEVWQTDTSFVGEAMKFRVTTTEGKKTSWKVADKHWQFGQTYVGKASS